MRRPRPILSPLLVGRDDLLALAERRIAEAADGHGGLVLLAGEAGVGKTRLLGAIREHAKQAHFKVTEGALAPQDRQVPLASMGDMARSLRDNPDFGTLGADLLALRHDRGADNLGSRRLLILDVVDLIAAAIDRPTLLMFEDLQWADELSLEVVGELAKLARQKPLLVVGTYRIDEIRAGDTSREWRARLLSQRQAEEVRLGPLTREQTALVTTLILDTGLPAPRDVVAAVYERSNGIPLHIEELLAALGEEGPVDAAAVRSAHVPDTIEDAVLARYARLSENAKSVARAAAVIGRCFIPEVVAGCLDRPLEALDGPLSELVDQAFLYPFDWLDHGFYDFRHQLLRDALYGVVPPSELRRLHARVGEFGGLIPGASDIHASVHFERAGLRPQAYRAALAGAKAASEVSSRREAFELYGRAVANLPDDVSPEEKADLYEAYCGAAFAIDDVPAIEETARLARVHNLAAGRPILAASNLVDLAGMARRDVRPVAERRAVLAQAEAELEALPESPERQQILSDVRLMQGTLERDALRLDDAIAMFDEARRLWLASGDSDTSNIDYMAAESYIAAGQVDEGLSTMLRIAREARERHSEGTGVTAFRWAAAMAVRVMDYPTAEIGLREGLEYADQIEQSYCRHVLAATSAHLDWTAGRWDAAEATAGLELVEKGSRRGTMNSRDVLGLVAMGRGETARARELFEATLAISRAGEEVDLILPALWGLAETALLANDPHGAIEACDEAWTLVEHTGERALVIPFVVTGMRAHLAARRPDTASDWLERMRGHLHDWMWLADRAVHHAEGLLRMANGSTGVARELLEAAVRGWDERGRIWEATWARIDLARCDLRANRPAEAALLLAEAETTAIELDSPPLRVAIAEVRRQLKGRHTDDEPWAPLTSREFEVARQVAAGLTNAEIAAALDIAHKTASAHVEHILAKLGMSRRAEIAAWASRVDGAATRIGRETATPAPGQSVGVARR